MDSLLQAIEALVAIKPTIMAIDGPCAGGKSTLAKRLGEHFPSAKVYHMDDFFLKPDMRTAQRLAMPGGNVDHERFLKELLLPLSQGQAFSYGAYNCQSGQTTMLSGEPAPLSIIEDSYSLHPALRGYYDLCVFLDIDPDQQARRILLRNGEKMAQRFFNEWIPMENRYFETHQVREASDLLLQAGP